MLDFLRAAARRHNGDNYVKVRGVYRAVLRDRDGRILSRTKSENLVVTLGKNFLLDTSMRASSYTVTGPYLGLIASIAGGGPAIGDSMPTHPGWVESATYGNRLLVSFPASSGGISSPTGVTFTSTGTDTINGAFLVLGTGALATAANTGGTLFSAGTFTAQPWVSGNTLTVTYSVQLS